MKTWAQIYLEFLIKHAKPLEIRNWGVLACLVINQNSVSSGKVTSQNNTPTSLFLNLKIRLKQTRPCVVFDTA